MKENGISDLLLGVEINELWKEKEAMNRDEVSYCLTKRQKELGRTGG